MTWQTPPSTSPFLLLFKNHFISSIIIGRGQVWGNMPKEKVLSSLQQQKRSIPQAVPPWPYSWRWFSLYDRDCDFCSSHAFPIRQQQQATKTTHFIFKVNFLIQREQLILSLETCAAKEFQCKS